LTWRVAEEDVQAILETDQDPDRRISLEPFIKGANVLTNRVSAGDEDGCMTADALFEVERYLAAHLYAARDQLYTSRSTGGASGSFQGQFGMRLDSTDYGQRAMLFDCTGVLQSINQGKSKATLAWVGKPPSEQIDDTDRD